MSQASADTDAKDGRARSLGSHYTLGELLGRGAMGEVYVAIDVETGERLAAKVLRAEHTDDDEVTARFLQERKLLRELRHPNIVAIRELVVDREQIAIIMDLIDGQDLRKRLRAEGRLAPAEAVRICADMLGALSLAHGLTPPLQHRDVKPDNILQATDGTVFLTDFGVARLAETGTSVKLTTGIGTADYMAPEMSGASAGAPADVYAVGITLYELLAGHTPFGRDSFQAIALRHITCQPPALEGLPATLWAHLSSMLAKNPASRPTAATAEARLRALLPELAGLPALPDTPAPTSWQQESGGVAQSAVAAMTGSSQAGAQPSSQATVLKGIAGAALGELPVAAVDAGIGLRRDGIGDDLDQQT
ncbi:MAG: serine/threonine protein kinase, partial [Actinomycetia bacterium]|nr:serine/threonine protein kinase [Actinomycetes bacterium]